MNECIIGDGRSLVCVDGLMIDLCVFVPPAKHVMLWLNLVLNFDCQESSISCVKFIMLNRWGKKQRIILLISCYKFEEVLTRKLLVKTSYGCSWILDCGANIIFLS